MFRLSRGTPQKVQRTLLEVLVRSADGVITPEKGKTVGRNVKDVTQFQDQVGMLMGKSLISF